MVQTFFKDIYSRVASLSFDVLAGIIWGSFGALFLLTLVLTLRSDGVKRASKRPFLCLVNCYAALTFAAFFDGENVQTAIFAAVLFWTAGYILYGVICFFSRGKRKIRTEYVPAPATAMPVSAPPPAGFAPEVPAAHSSVRLEHALAVTQKLLSKNLGKSDRQELERLRTTLGVLQTKGTLSREEADILNDNFNALLKLMAKYNV